MAKRCAILCSLALMLTLFLYTGSSASAPPPPPPQKVIVVFDGLPPATFDPQCVTIQRKITIEVWNVGSAGGGNYGDATYTVEGPSCDIDSQNNVTPGKPYKSVLNGTFSGGPDGVLILSDPKNPQLDERVTFIHGTTAHVSLSDGNVTLFMDIPVANPQAFFGDQATLTPEPTLPPSPTPGTPCQPVVSNIKGLKPGDVLSPAVDYVGPDGQPVGVLSSVWYINGVEANSVTWDGKETSLVLQYTCTDNSAHEKRFTIHAYSAGAPAAPDNNQPGQNPPQPPVEQPAPPAGNGTAGGLMAVGAVVAGAIAAAAGAGAAAAARGAGTAGGSSAPSGSGSGGPASHPTTHFDGQNSCSTGLPFYRVNTASLGLVIEDSIIYAENVGPALDIQLTYNSSDLGISQFGRGWRMSYDSSVQQNGDLVSLSLGSGQVLAYRKQSKSPASETVPQELDAPQGIFDRLYDYGSYWVYFHKESGLRYFYRRAPGQNGALLTEVMDISDNRLCVQYDAQGRIDKIMDAAGRETSFTYSTSRCTGFRMCDNRRAVYQYDPRGFLVQAVDLAGIVAVYSYDPQGYLTGMTIDRDQRTTTFTYQAGPTQPCLATISDANGKTVYQIVTGPQTHVHKIDPARRTTDYYSQNYQTTAIVDSTGAAVQTRYANSLPVEMQNRSGGVFTFAYDGNGNLIEKREPDGGVWRSSFDRNNHLLSATDPGGRIWKYAYDTLGRLVTLVSPGGEMETWSYNTQGQNIKIVAANGAQTRLRYDSFGNLVNLIDPLGCQTQLYYDPQGYRLTALMKPGGAITRFEQDGNGRFVKVTFPDGAVYQMQYNCCSGTGEIDENGNRTQYRRDSALRVSEITLADGGRYLFEYDRAQRTTAWSDPLGHQYTIQYEAARRLDILSNPLHSRLVRQYGPSGQMVNLWDENGNRNTYTYDPSGRLTAVTTPGGGTAAFAYAPGGLLQSARNGRGQIVAFEYDASGARETRRLWNGKAVAGLQYDQVGNLTATQDGRGAARYAYDLSGRLVEITYPDARQVRFAYDPDGHLQAVTYPDGLVVSYQSDNRSRPIALAWGKNIIQCRYDPAGNLLGLTRSNHTESLFTYAANGAIQSVRHTRGQDILADMQYQRNGLGSPGCVSGVFPLEPTPAEPLQRCKIGPGNQVLSDGTDEMAYDADGNLVKIGAGRWAAAYDPEGRLVDVQRSAGRQSFAYDVLGQCVSRITNGKAQNYYYDLEGRLLFETGSDHTVTARYIYIGRRLAALDVPGTGSLFYHFDALGNCLSLTNESGKPVAAYAYQPFGLYQSRVDSGVNNPFTFVGEYGVRDEGDGLYLMRHRHYEAYLGRFVQPDPIGVAGGSNLYAYSGQNPTTFIDPSGLVGPVVVFLGAIILLGVAGAVYVVDAGAKSIYSSIAQKKVTDNALAAMANNSSQFKVAEKVVDKIKPTGMPTGPAQDLLGMGKAIGTTVAENALPGVGQGASAVKTVVVEGVKTAVFEGANQTLDSVTNTVVPRNASGTQTIKSPSTRKHGCPTK